MSMNDIKNQLVLVVRDIVATDTIFDERNFDRPFKELGIDSLDTMLLFLKVQEHFGIGDIPEKQIDKLTTINKIAAYVENVKGNEKPV